MSLGAALLQVIGPFIVRHAVDDQIQQGRTDDLALLVGLYVGTLLGVFVLFFVQAILMTYVAQRMMMDLRLQLFTHVRRCRSPSSTATRSGAWSRA